MYFYPVNYLSSTKEILFYISTIAEAKVWQLKNDGLQLLYEVGTLSVFITAIFHLVLALSFLI